jgi:hypothetical protein
MHVFQHTRIACTYTHRERGRERERERERERRYTQLPYPSGGTTAFDDSDADLEDALETKLDDKESYLRSLRQKVLEEKRGACARM